MTKNFLAIDISPRRSRSWFFSDRSGSFALHGCNSQPGAPEDVQALMAGLTALEAQTGMKLFNAGGRFNFSDQDDDGLERVGLTFSAGAPIRTAVIGLSEKFSLQPLRRLVNFFNCEIVLEINVQKEPNISAQLEKLVNTGFDLLLVAGGVNNGPERALKAVINNLRLLVQLRGAERPQIVYAGNQALGDYAKLELEMGDDFYLAGNIQPDSQREDLSFAYPAMIEAIKRIWYREFPELKRLFDHPKIDVLPVEFARARMGQWLEETQKNEKGVLQIHLEAEFGQVIANRDGRRMAVWEHLSATPSDIEAVSKSLELKVEPFAVAAYMLNKLAYPAFIPATMDELSIEMAWIRYRIKNMLSRLNQLDPLFLYDETLGLKDGYEPILLSVPGLELLPSIRHFFLVLLDGIMPSGITTFVWDDLDTLPALGVLAKTDSLLAAQVVDTDIFTSLAMVVNVNSPLSVGQTVLRLEVDEGEGELRQHHQVLASELKRIEGPPGNDVRVYLSPDESSDVGMGLPGLGGWVSTPPSRIGIIIDARGRPIQLPADPIARREAQRDWLWELGA